MGGMWWVGRPGMEEEEEDPESESELELELEVEPESEWFRRGRVGGRG